MRVMHKHALVVGKFAPLHRGHMQLLEAARAASERLTVLVWSNPDFPEMPNAARAGWIKSLFPEIDVRVPEVSPPNEAPDDVQRHFVKHWLAQHGIQPDVVFSSENYGPGFASVLGCQHVMGQRCGISGTQIRSDIHSYRTDMHPRVYAHFVKRVVFLGAESTGKSTLTEYMAKKLSTVFVPEYGREVWQRKQGNLMLDDYVHIAEKHRQLEDEAIFNANRYLFVDTNAITTLFLSYYYHRGGLPRLHELADECVHRYQQVFVCADDIPFEQDGWRDNALLRERVQGLVLHDLDRRGISYSVLRGDLEARARSVVSTLRERDW